jgi:hypothetical protein
VLVEDRHLAAGLLDRLRERALLDDVAAEVDVAEDGGVALELAGVVEALQLELEVERVVVARADCIVRRLSASIQPRKIRSGGRSGRARRRARARSRSAARSSGVGVLELGGEQLERLRRAGGAGAGVVDGAADRVSPGARRRRRSGG